MDLDHLSASTIDSFESCPRRAYLAKSSGIRSSSSALDIGSAVHAVLENYHLCKLDKPLDEAFVDVMTEQYVTFDAARFRQAIEMLKVYEANNPLPEGYENPTVATEFEFDMDVDGYRVVGKIDRIDYLGGGVYKIIDYKTSYMPKKIWEVEEDNQLLMYDIALRDAWSRGLMPGLDEPKEVICSLYYLRHYEMETTFDDAQRDSMRRYVKYMGDLIKAMDGPPQPKLGPFCGSCSFRQDCEAYNSPAAASYDAGSRDDLYTAYEDLKYASKVVGTELARVEAEIFDVMNREGLESFETAHGTLAPTSRTFKRYDMGVIKRDLPGWERYVKFDSKMFNEIASAEERAVVEKATKVGRSSPFLMKVAKSKRKE